MLGQDEVFSLILPENKASQAVARRLGFTLQGEKVFAFFPAAPHGIWRRGRDQLDTDQFSRVSTVNLRCTSGLGRLAKVTVVSVVPFREQFR